jgi:plasmid stabilization system protein ParE
MEKTNEMDIVFKKRFQKKVSKLSLYLEKSFGQGSVKKFWSAFDHQISIIRKFPESGAPTKIPGVRSFIAGKHSRVYYKVFDNNIVIINMYDMRQDPSKNIYK